MSEDLLDYCTAPMPYIMGVHSSLIGRVLQEPLESHVFVDIDADKGMLMVVPLPVATRGFGITFKTGIALTMGCLCVSSDCRDL